MEPHHLNRHSRLEKQEEFEVEEEGFMLSPVTIQIEDRGENQAEDELYEEKGKESMCGFDDDASSDAAEQESSISDPTVDSTNSATEPRSERRKSSGRVKLLVRSHAVHDDASPPPDLETITTNTNMLSVTNASSFSTQTQSKGASNKLRLGHQSSSQGSTESSSASGLSRDSSTETYTDSSGVDLQQFIVDTLHKNQKDRLMLLKIEQELTVLVKDNKRQSLKFPQMSSYNRMLVHRVAAFFGLDHYVDGNGTAVIVNKTKTTRTPDSRFQDFIRDELLPEEPKKSILKRDSISFEEGKEKSPERQSSTDSRRSKSFEEREEEYEKARARIFNQDEGLGESPLNRSQEGTYSSSRRSSQEDIRWPSSETRPWSSTDSDSSGRPLGAKLSSSFEADASAQNGAKNARSFGVLAKVESENKSLLIPTRTSRPAMTKASSFGGISVLSRENSTGKCATPRITKAESFNVTTLSSSNVSQVVDGSLEPHDDHINPSPSPTNLTSSVAIQTNAPSQQPVATGTAEQTFPSVAGQPNENHGAQVSSQQVSERQLGSQDSSSAADFISHLTVGQPLMWPYSANTDLIFPGNAVINQPIGCQRMAFSPYQPLAVPVTNQVPSAAGHISAVTTVSPSGQQPAQRQQLHTIQPQQTVNTSSPPAVFYVPYVSQIPSTVTHQPTLTPGQNVPRQLHQTQQSQFLNEPRPLVLFPGCYMHTSNVHPVRYIFSTNTAQQCVQGPAQSTGGSGQPVADIKNHGIQPNSSVLNPQYLCAYPALAFSQSGEASTTTTAAVTTAIYPYTNVIGTPCQAAFKPPLSSQSSSQAPSCTSQQQPPLTAQAPVSLPPVYVSITSSTQSPATQTHAGGHIASQFSSFRSQSFPLASSSSSLTNRHLNAGTPILGYTVYAPPVGGQAPMTAVTLHQNTHASSPASHFTPAYVTALQVLQPSVSVLGSGSNLASQGTARCVQYPGATLAGVNKVPLSFPLVKQASDPGVADCLALSNYLCLVGHPVQHHLAHLMLPQQLPMSRFPRTSISSHIPLSRPPKTRKQRSKASGGSSSSSGALSSPSALSVFDIKGDHVIEIGGLPEDMKQCDAERYLEEVIEHGAKIYFVNADNMGILDNGSDAIVSDKHLVLAVFDCDTAAHSALLNIKTTKFRLHRWHHCREDRQGANLSQASS